MTIVMKRTCIKGLRRSFAKNSIEEKNRAKTDYFPEDI